MLLRAKIALLSMAVAAASHASEQGLELRECLTLPSFAEQESCLQAHVRLLELKKNLTELNVNKQDSGQIKHPIPVAYLASKSVAPMAIIRDAGGEVTARKGDRLTGGWQIVDISRTVVTLQRGNETLYVGYGDGDAQDQRDYGLPAPLLAPSSLGSGVVR